MISRTVEDFWDCYNHLPANVRETAQKAYEVWQLNHYHPSLHFKPVSQNIYSVRVGRRYRAVGLVQKEGGQDTITWFWIGTHAGYDKLIENL